jgi:hypothetical protein
MFDGCKLICWKIWGCNFIKDSSFCCFSLYRWMLEETGGCISNMLASEFCRGLKWFFRRMHRWVRAAMSVFKQALKVIAF